MNVRRFVTRLEIVSEPVLEDERTVRKGVKLRSPERVYHCFAFLRTAITEEFHVAIVNAKHEYMGTALVSAGTLTSSLVHPREVFRAALLVPNACAIMVAHNHPSGCPEPSAEDLEVTKRLCDGGRLLGIPVLDHVIIGDGRFVSLRERMNCF